MSAGPLLLVGLGNPGPAYAGNRHNIGFNVVDAICDRHGFGPFRRKFDGQVAEGRIGDRRVLALKPMTYMNESGRAVGQAARFHKIPPVDVVVFHDELDLAAGKVRVKDGGGLAGHNGLRSISAHIGPAFRRVRLGIGHPGGKDRVTGHVLKDFAKADRVWLDPLLEACATHAPLLVAGDAGAFMSKVAMAVNPPRPKPPRPAPQSSASDSDATGSDSDGL